MRMSQAILDPKLRHWVNSATFTVVRKASQLSENQSMLREFILTGKAINNEFQAQEELKMHLDEVGMPKFNQS